jgi:hypothetical protein
MKTFSPRQYARACSFHSEQSGSCVQKGFLWTLMGFWSLCAGLQADTEAPDWWAIEPIERPAFPSSASDHWTRNPIDYFVMQRLKEAGLAPAPEADRAELIRRAYFDLIGLPPSSEAIEDFVTDPHPDAWIQLVEGLLESPHYGERWGQHWLDVTRWAESDGYRQDAFRPHAWPYRDYVIKAFNQDKPYDRFVREQLAGDELEPDNPEVTIATAYLRNGIYEYNQRNVEMHWELIVDELTSLTGEAIMGVGIGCAQCHDHKFDPIPQEDYFRIKAMLAPVSWEFDRFLATSQQRESHRLMQEAWQAQTHSIRQQIDAIIEPRIKAKQEHALGMFPDAIQAIFQMPAEQRTPYQVQLMDLASIQIRYERERFDAGKEIKGEEGERLKALQKELAAFDELKPEELTPAFIASDVGNQAPAVWIKGREGKSPVSPGFLSVLEPGVVEDEPSSSSHTTGRRLKLAQWLTDRSHPLTPRVMVNRLWQKHFSEGMVASLNDFGQLGQRPSHPDLLNWLASEFIDSGWSIKHIHRLIMTSATYLQTARLEPDGNALTIDPQNRWLWRYPPKRLDAAQIRDAMLMASGELNLAMGGPSVLGSEPRRSVYVRKIRNTPDEMLKGFDAPTGFHSTPTRDSTTTTTQALLMINGSWVLDRSRAMSAALIEAYPSNPVAWVEHAYQRCYGRIPREEERERALEFLRTNNDRDAALMDFCHVMLSSNEFLYLH